MDTVRGCSNCMTEFRNMKTGLCPFCKVGTVDTYSKVYWNSEFQAYTERIKQRMNDKKSPATDAYSIASDELAKKDAAYQHARNAFRDDLIRLCRIHEMVIEPLRINVGAVPEDILVITDLTSEGELKPLQDAY